MKALRIVVGLTLALIVAGLNGIAAYGYLGAATFETLFTSRPTDDPRWTTTATEEGSRHQPRDGAALFSLLTDSKHGKFSLFLAALCNLQFAAGMALVFVSRDGRRLFAFLVSVAVLGIVAELLGGAYSSSFGVTNWLGVVVSVLVVGMAFSLRTDGLPEGAGRV